MTPAAPEDVGTVAFNGPRGRRCPLQALFAPRRVAVIGATERPGSVGAALMANLDRFPGEVLPVNPRHSRIGGRPAFPSLRAVIGPVDLAVIATPAPSVPAIIRECAATGVPAAVVISAGFRECGPAGRELEEQCREEARRGQVRLLGPNCLGLMVPHSGLNATFAGAAARPGHVAFLSQSGALCTAVLDWSLRENVGFSAFVSVGSMLDVGWGDLLTHCGDDPHTRSIVCYMESIGDARSFLSAAREVALTKPIIVLKVGHTEAAARAAASHTGAMTGSDAVLDAAFRRAGVLRVNTVAELFNMAELLAKQPRVRGPRLAIVTNAGGPGALAIDALVAAGGRPAELAPATLAALDRLLPPHWSHGNPIDVLGDADATRFARAVELAARDPEVDGVLMVLTPQAMTDASGIARAVGCLRRPGHPPLLASWMGGAAVEAGRALLNDAGIPTFNYPDTAARAFALMWRYSDNLRALYETTTLAPEEVCESAAEAPAPGRLRGDGDSAHPIIALARQQGRTLLTEVEAKQLLSDGGVPVTPTLAARTEEEAVRHATTLGYPVVVKLLSATLTHKTDVGGVRLDLRNAAAVRRAWREIQAAVAEKAGAQHFQGVTVQPMVRAEGYEIILGSSIDPQFGPVLLFGAGGQLVEVWQDRALGLPPLNGTLARRLMEQTRIFAALRGVRGRAPVDLVALERVLVRFSQVVAAQRWIAEVDVNPLLVAADRIVALDARVVLHPPGTPAAQLPRPAIRPYPAQYVESWRLRDGTPVFIRPIRPDDEARMAAFQRSLSDRSVYLRYFSPLRLDERTAHENLARLCFADYDREITLVAEAREAGSGTPVILGMGCLTKLHQTNEAEFALVVADAWQKRGLGLRLLQRLITVARQEGLERIVGTMLPDNRDMHHLARKAGFTVEHTTPQGEWRAVLRL